MLSNELYEDAKAIHDKASRVINKEGKIISQRTQYAVDLLALSRDGIRRVDADFEAKTKALKDKIAPFSVERAKLKKELEGVSESMEKALLASLAENGEVPEETDAGTTLHITRRPKLRIIDADKVPDEFVLPRAVSLDTTKIADVLSKERAINKTRVENGMKPLPYSIPGVTLDEVIGFSTKLSEVYGE